MDDMRVLPTYSNVTDPFEAYAGRMSEVCDQFQQRFASTSFESPVNGHPIVVYHDNTPEAESYLSSLMHLRCQNLRDNRTGTIVWVDRGSVNEHIPFPPFKEHQYTGYGQRGFTQKKDWKFLHAPTVGLEMGYHPPTKRGFVITNGMDHLSIYDRATPFQSVIHWMLEPSGWHMAHAAVVGANGKGAMLVGSSGSGKSTTALSCLVHPEMDYLCDDKCMLSLDPDPQAFAIFNAVKLNHDVKDWFPFFNDIIVGKDEIAKKGKNLAFLYPKYRDNMVKSLPIQTILIPRMGSATSYGISPARAADAFRVFGPSTSIWVPLSGPSNFRFLREFTEKLPCYFLDLHPEIAINAQIIKRHLEEMK